MGNVFGMVDEKKRGIMMAAKSIDGAFHYGYKKSQCTHTVG